MKNKIINILQIMALTLSIYAMPMATKEAYSATNSNVTTNLGPFKIGRAFCEQIQKISAIMNVYTNVIWPVVGFPGITSGLLQNTSVLLDFCAFIINLETLGTTDAIFYSANYLNTLTGNKWDHHLEFMNSAWTLTNDVMDLENGGMRKGALKSVAVHKEINDFMNTSYKWYNKTFNDKDAELKTRGQRENDMAALSNAAYNRAILKDAINCPVGDNSVNYQKVYASEIEPKQKLMNEAKEELEFYRNQLYVMGPRFLANEKELNSYIAQIENIMINGVTLKTTESTTQVTTVKKEKAKNGTVTDKKVKINRTTQSFTAFENNSLVTDFKNNFTEKWGSWVTAQYLSSGSKGLLDDPKGRVENEFKDLSYECNRSKLMQGVSSDRADYQVEEDKRYTTCLNEAKMNEKQAANLFDYYVTKMYEKIKVMKQNQAIVWTKESKYLGTSRTVTKNVTDGFQQEEVKCSESGTLSQAQLAKLGLKQQDVNNQLTEMIAKQALKQTAMQEAEAQASADQADQLAKKASFVEKRVKEDEKMSKTSLAPVMPEINVCYGDDCENFDNAKATTKNKNN